MALPQQLKTNRYSDSTAVSSTDNNFATFEQVVADLFAIPVNTDQSVPRAVNRFASVADSATVSNTSSETAFSKTYSIPANSLAVGDEIRVRARLRTQLSGGGQVQFAVRVGGGTKRIMRTVAWSSPPISLGAVHLETTAVVRTIGATGTVALGLQLGAIDDGSGSNNQYKTAPVSSAPTIDTTGALTVDVTVQFSVADATNNAVLEMLAVEIRPAAATA